MKQHFLIQQNHKRLLLFFAGWGMDARPFCSFQPKDCDWMICYDYRSAEFNVEALANYSEIIVIGWSMGVWVASEVMQLHPELPIKGSLAINGTPYPIDDQKGIPSAIYEGTLEGLNDNTLQKFQRRMCGSNTEYQTFQQTAPQRPIEELKEELIKIRERYLSSTLRRHSKLSNQILESKQPEQIIKSNQTEQIIESKQSKQIIDSDQTIDFNLSNNFNHSISPNESNKIDRSDDSIEPIPDAFRWECAIVGKADRIFPTANQLEAWSNQAERVVQVNEPHYSHELFSQIFS